MPVCMCVCAHVCVCTLQSLHEELVQQQESFDSLAQQAQILMQSSTDSRVSTQLTQITSRYNTLVSASKVRHVTLLAKTFVLGRDLTV